MKRTKKLAAIRRQDILKSLSDNSRIRKCIACIRYGVRKPLSENMTRNYVTVRMQDVLELATTAG
jgi:hypothetical protein